MAESKLINTTAKAMNQALQSIQLVETAGEDGKHNFLKLAATNFSVATTLKYI